MSLHLNSISRRIISITFFLIFFVEVVFCAQVKKYIDRGIEYYLAGRWEDAVIELETAFSISPKNRKAKALLIKALTRAAEKYFDKEDYISAIPYLKRTLQFSPYDLRIKGMLDFAQKKIGIAPFYKEGKVKKEKIKPKEKVPIKKKKAIFTKPKIIRKIEPKPVKVTRAVTKEKIALLSELIRSKQYIIKKRFYLLFTVYLSVFFLFVFLIPFLYFKLKKIYQRYSSKAYKKIYLEDKRIYDSIINTNTKILERKKERTLKLIENVSNIIFPATEKMVDMMKYYTGIIVPKDNRVVTETEKGKKVLTDIDTRFRVKADIIERIPLWVTDENKAQRLLLPYIDSKDNRIRGNAVKSLYRYNKKKALIALEKMCENSNHWMRLSGAWVLGEIKDLSLIEVLFRLCSDPKEIVKKRALFSLEKFLEIKILPENIKQRIKEILRKNS